MDGKIKLFSRVRLQDGTEGDVMEVYEQPEEGYDVDIGDPDPCVPLPENWIRSVKRSEIESVLWEPKD